LTDIQSYFVLH